ncbi:MFS family permease [Kibdelosporangium banguiense]|uniref:MFS family permease n=1 Tax=Kibdelosporangium banguiense TaxID=1365924 RepID=A0ABS4TPG4_9PSEU|nr:hypothetical protein [Kibdelosporangium banguiense]MBP2325811.1 MFS family permease [Kibdelosporangium banguiense]
MTQVAVNQTASGGPGMLVAARALQGIGAAVLMRSTFAIIHTVFPGRRRPRWDRWSPARR